MITAIDMFQRELRQETESTKKLIALVPADKWTWKPHEKSMSLGDLAVHIVDVPGWMHHAVFQDVLDFAVTPYQPSPCKNSDELLALFEKKVNLATEALSTVTLEQLEDKWTMKNGDMVLMELEKWETIRHSFDQLIHHRAQLGVYLRLLNIPLPGVYGPSADDLEKM